MGYFGWPSGFGWPTRIFSAFLERHTTFVFLSFITGIFLIFIKTVTIEISSLAEYWRNDFRAASLRLQVDSRIPDASCTARRSDASAKGSHLFQGLVYSRCLNEVRLPAYIGFGSNRRSQVSPNSDALKPAGS